MGPTPAGRAVAFGPVAGPLLIVRPGILPAMPDPILCVHGGAGSIRRDDLLPESDRRMRDGLRRALRAGQQVLQSGGSALDAVTAAVTELESCEVFNAGRGSVLTSAGEVQMDASIMRGRDRAAGAVACVRRIVHPIQAARLLLRRGEHVLLVGAYADAFAAGEGLATDAPGSFVTESRRRELDRASRATLDHDVSSPSTVGAVALDGAGSLAAATSTGGMTRQAPGRVGDSPLIGAGTWADDRSCAVSATGPGERIMRAAMCHEIDGLIRHAGHALRDACQRALAEVEALGGRAGCIALDPQGNFAMPFTSSGMARGVARGTAEPRVALFGDEPEP